MPASAAARFPTRRALAMLAATLVLHAVSAFAQPSRLKSPVKAAFVYKFASFVEWPAMAFDSTQTPLTICVLGGDPVARLVDEAARGQSNGTRPIMVTRIARVPADSRCHVLYALGTRQQSAANAIAAVRGKPVLTITDSGRTRARGMIDFVVQADRVRFDIDARAAAESGLVISSKLLDLARSVIGRG